MVHTFHHELKWLLLEISFKNLVMMTKDGRTIYDHSDLGIPTSSVRLFGKWVHYERILMVLLEIWGLAKG